MTLGWISTAEVHGLSLTARVSYAVKSLPPGTMFTASELSDATGIPSKGMGQTLCRLSNLRVAGWDRYQSGRGAYEVPIYEVIG